MVPGSQPNKRKALKRHGYRTRMKTKDGQRVLARRRSKGREQLAKTIHSK